MAPSPPNQSLIDRATQAAISVARQHGLTVDAAESLGGYSNTIVRLKPLPLVARVATNRARTGADWLEREIEVAAFLAAKGVRAIRPTPLIPPGPHMHDGLALSFWEHLDLIDGSATPAELGAALRHLHAHLEHYDAALPVFAGVEETYQLLHDESLTAALSDDLTGVLRRAATLNVEAIPGSFMFTRALHGDAHHANYWKTSDGWVWGDFEDVQIGPIEWDLACLCASSIVFGNTAAAREALAAYGAHDADALSMLIEARTLQAIAWALVVLPNPMGSERFQKRVRWLAAL